MNKTVSRKFKFATEDRIAQLKCVSLKKKTELKMNWAVNVYTEWRNNRLLTFHYDYGIYNTDLGDLENLTKENLAYSLCRFLPEVTKQRGEGLYLACTLYQMIVAIQKHLHVHKFQSKLIDGSEFQDVRIVLDNLMKEHTAENVGVSKKQAQVIMYEMEQKLQAAGMLGEDTPEKLCDTVLFLLGINLFLRAVDEHYNLRRDMPT